MKTKSKFWADLSTRDFAQLDAARTIAVLPLAATEQHGPHLPVSVDTALVDGVVAACLPLLSANLSVLFLPTQAVGLSPEHQRFPGTVTLSSHTIISLWTEIGESVARVGIKKLVLFNSHGGQVSVMDIVARDLRSRLDLLVYSVNWFNLPLGPEVDNLFSADEHRFGIHAGEIETSMMLALAPDRVTMSLAKNFASSSQQRAQQFAILGNGKSAKLGWQMQDYNMAGAVGNAAGASADKGRAVLQAAGRALAQLLAELDQLPPDTLVDTPVP
jgi:creatinine amidohydrolase